MSFSFLVRLSDDLAAQPVTVIPILSRGSSGLLQASFSTIFLGPVALMNQRAMIIEYRIGRGRRRS